jgi:hypothetical protein
LDNSLLNLKEFCLITFVSTSNALKAETVLKNEQADFLITPTLREISYSCGLSIKVRPENTETYRQLLITNNVAIEKVYQVSKAQNKYLITEYPTE